MHTPGYPREDARLARHFESVLADLGPRPGPARRDAVLVELGRYARAGRFPRNHHTKNVHAPTFVDPATGARCAVAHLLESTGEGALMWDIARANNAAMAWELALDPRVLAWAERVGLTARELERIQPSYCATTWAESCVCWQLSADAIAVGEIVELQDWKGLARVTEVVGTGAEASPGDVRPVSAAGMALGDQVLFPAGPPITGDSSYPGLLLESGKVAACDESFDLSKEDAIQVLLAGDGCGDALEALDPRWGTSHCDDPGPKPSRAGCSIGPVADPSAAWGAAAILLASAARRVRRRAR